MEQSEAGEQKLKVLVTDDSKLLRKKLRLELEKAGCEVMEAENGKEAVMLTLQEKPDCVFLDIVMPEVGGIEALRVIKEVSPDLPVIMLSSAGTPQKLMETLKLGARDFIQKPYTTSQILQAIESIRKKASENE
ncbi:MAG: response regulator [Schwartzia sp.]|nr:response regulator [Schwartzia sp. (in: firmicutes)]